MRQDARRAFAASTSPHRAPLYGCALCALSLLILARTPVSPAAAPARGIVIAAESFDYPGGTELGKANGGAGWSGAWMTSALQPADNRISAPGLARGSRPASGAKVTTAGQDV